VGARDHRCYEAPVLELVVLFALAAAIAAYVAAALWLDRRGRRAPPDDRFDAIVVLGCRVTPRGHASPSLARRARHGVSLLGQGVAPVIAFTGGVCGGGASEARAAANVARGLGVRDDQMVLEERSTSTEGNAREAAKLLSAAKRVVVVTDAYHTFRAERVFGRHFAQVVAVGSVGTLPVRAHGALREVAVVVAYALLGRL